MLSEVETVLAKTSISRLILPKDVHLRRDARVEVFDEVQ